MIRLTDLKELAKHIKRPWMGATVFNIMAEIGAMKTVATTKINDWIYFFLICSIVVFLIYISEIILTERI